MPNDYSKFKKFAPILTQLFTHPPIPYVYASSVFAVASKKEPFLLSPRLTVPFRFNSVLALFVALIYI